MNREEAIAQLKDLIRDRKSFIENDDPNNVYRDDSGGRYNVLFDTVGQYTGVMDAGGKRIFEGDVVKWGNTIHEVVFEQRNNAAYFGMVRNKVETLSFDHFTDRHKLKVVGNIYDNPILADREADE